MFIDERTSNFSIYTNNQELHSLYENHVNQINKNHDSGFDLFIPDDVIFEPNETKLVDLQVMVTKTDYTYFDNGDKTERSSHRTAFLVIPRSSIYKTPLIMRNSIGLIDCQYNGTLKVPLYNLSNETYILKKHTRIVQAVYDNLSSPHASIEKIGSMPESTNRGTGGFGSTGE
jgi:deoxyuridine 5'-triphosphate nucleotidohydrolase